jgi:Fe-S-cluster containining protein
MNDWNKTPLDKDKDINIYTKSDICGSCKGLCCKKAAGIYAPEDFNHEITIAYVLSLLLAHNITLDFEEHYLKHGDVIKQYFLRPRHLDEDPVKPLSLGGVCSNWNYEKGCSLSEEKRPYQCRMLIPLADGETCMHKEKDKARKHNMIERWEKYHDILKSVEYLYPIFAQENTDITSIRFVEWIERKLERVTGKLF